MPRIEHVVTASEQGSRLDVLLARIKGVPSRSVAVRLVDAGAVSVNGMPATKKRVLVEGDLLVCDIVVPVPAGLVAEDIPLDIRYEDEDLIVLSKQAGLVCHPSRGHETGTLVNALIAHCGYEGLARLQGDERPGIVHRLDQDTTGLMLVAKTDEAGTVLQEGIRAKAIDRRYLALVHGYIAPDTGLIDAPIARGQGDRQRMVVSEGAGARPSVTTFTVLERFDAGRFDDGYTLMECKLFTGRTHQIRVHLDHIRHPCVGDPLYGPQNRPKAQLGLTRQFLHSWRLSLDHPLSGAPLSLLDPLPDDLASALASLEERSLGRTEAGEGCLPGLPVMAT